MLSSNQVSYANNNGAPNPQLFEVRNDSTIVYLPNADFQLWAKPLLTRSAICLAATPLILYFLHFTNLLTPMLSLVVVYLRLFRDFLTSNSASTIAVWLASLRLMATPVFIVVGCGIAGTVIHLLRQPNVIALSKSGMIFGRVFHKDKNYTQLKQTKRVLWQEITDLKIIRPPNTRSNRDYCFEFYQDSDKPFRMRIGDIINPGDREAFINIIKGQFSHFVDDEALEVFTPPRDRQSYTELWLAELSAPPKRDRLTPLEVGARVNNQKYEVLSKLGVGGQGTVYLAATVSGGADVVLKEFVLPVFPDTNVRKAAAVRFQDEATLLTKLNHPQIVKLKELFLEDHRAYLVLEHLTGQNLKDLVGSQGALPAAEILRLAHQMCDILVYLHGQTPPVVHRDFTPDNLILDEDGYLKLIDFSVAQTFTSNVTGSVVGKPHYIAPEQFRGKPTVQSDLYSMGATLFYLATGIEPEPITMIRLSEYQEKPDAVLARVIEKATRLDVGNRYKSAAEVLKDLNA